MSRRAAVVAVWLIGTSFATALAFAAVSVVLHGVSEHRAEQLRYGGTIIIKPASLIASSTATGPAPSGKPRSNHQAVPTSTTDVATSTPTTAAVPTTPPAAGAVAAPTTPSPTSPGGDQGTGSPSGPSGESPDHGGAPAPTTTTPPGNATSITYSTRGGAATVVCSGEVIHLVSSSPNSGFTMEVSDAGPGEVRVRFRSSSESYDIQANCSDGVAQLGDD